LRWDLAASEGVSQYEVTVESDTGCVADQNGDGKISMSERMKMISCYLFERDPACRKKATYTFVPPSPFAAGDEEDDDEALEGAGG
jgi:hypothetical protein